jgi:23S rRNA (guanosine2251-2'-O)-methyltransferase
LRGREKEAVLLGFHAVRARLKAAPHTLRRVLYVADRRDARLKALLEALALAGVSAQSVDAGRLDQEAKGERHQGILALAEQTAQPTDLESLLESRIHTTWAPCSAQQTAPASLL